MQPWLHTGSAARSSPSLTIAAEQICYTGIIVTAACAAACADFCNMVQTVPRSDLDVLIAGGGFAGLTLAVAWRQYIELCIEAFGPDRCMFESNFPPDKQSGGYTELWNAFKRITSGASAAEKRALYSGTAARVYRLTVP